MRVYVSAVRLRQQSTTNNTQPQNRGSLSYLAANMGYNHRHPSGCREDVRSVQVRPYPTKVPSLAAGRPLVRGSRTQEVQVEAPTKPLHRLHAKAEGAGVISEVVLIGSTPCLVRGSERSSRSLRSCRHRASSPTETAPSDRKGCHSV